MSKTPNAVLRAWRAPPNWSADWWDPEELLALVRQESARFNADQFFNAPNLKPLREAHAAASFARAPVHLKPCLVRMVEEQFPDFRLKIEAQHFDFELVEADVPGRRRGAEYRQLAKREAAGETLTPEPYNFWSEKLLVPDAILSAIKRKTAKLYAERPHLLVYVNLGNMGGPALGPQQAADLTRQWHGVFKSIWLLCGTDAILCTA